MPTGGDGSLPRATIIAALIGVLGTVSAAIIGTRSGERRADDEAQVLEARVQQQESTIQTLQGQLAEKETAIRSLESRLSQQGCEESAGGGSPPPAPVSAAQGPFETESYRLTTVDVKKSGNTARVTMLLEGIGEGGVHFDAGDWYLLDENGERWTLSLPNRGEIERELEAGVRRPFRDGIRLVPGTKAKDSLVFSATGSGQGTSFTLIGAEVAPQSRREIILRGLTASGG